MPVRSNVEYVSRQSFARPGPRPRDGQSVWKVRLCGVANERWCLPGRARSPGGAERAAAPGEHQAAATHDRGTRDGHQGQEVRTGGRQRTRGQRGRRGGGTGPAVVVGRRRRAAPVVAGRGRRAAAGGGGGGGGGAGPVVARRRRAAPVAARRRGRRGRARAGPALATRQRGAEHGGAVAAHVDRHADRAVDLVAATDRVVAGGGGAATAAAENRRAAFAARGREPEHGRGVAADVHRDRDRHVDLVTAQDGVVPRGGHLTTAGATAGDRAALAGGDGRAQRGRAVPADVHGHLDRRVQLVDAADRVGPRPR